MSMKIIPQNIGKDGYPIDEMDSDALGFWMTFKDTLKHTHQAHFGLDQES